MNVKKILYISTHPLLSHAIKLFLLSDLQMNFDISIVSMDEFLRLDTRAMISNPPDLILFPVGFIGNPNLNQIGEYRAKGIETPVIILCPTQAVPCFDELVKNKVQGIISTTDSLEELREFVYAVLDHKPGTLKEQYARATAASYSSAQTLGLTDREIEILHLLASGKNDNEIAQKLKISVKTVKTHLGHIYIKLQAENRVQAVVIAVSKNIISPYKN